MNRDAIVQQLEDSSARIAEHASSPEAEHDRTYGPGKWTVRQIMAHLADVEMINLWRFLRAVAEPGAGVEPFDENEWAARLDYATRPVAISGELVRACRAALIHHVSTLPSDRLEGASVHPEKGPMSGWQWAQLFHDHAVHHLTQIEAAREGRPWTPPPRTPDSWKFMGEPPPD